MNFNNVLYDSELTQLVTTTGNVLYCQLTLVTDFVIGMTIHKYVT